MSSPSKRIEPAVGSMDARDQPRERRLAAAGFADEADGFARWRRRDRRRRRHARLRCLPKKLSFGSGKCFTTPRNSQHRHRRCAFPPRAWPARAMSRQRLPRRGRRQRLAVLRHPAARSAAGHRLRPASGCCAQRSMRKGQRAAKRQPSGQCERIGRRALDGDQALVARDVPVERGTALISAQV